MDNNELNFNDVNELQTYLTENSLNFKDLKISHSNKQPICEGNCNLLNENINVNLLFLSDNPTVISAVGKKNILFVENMEIAENVCMPTRIDFYGRNIWLNMCNSDGKTTAKLNLVVEGKVLYNIPFEIQVSTSKEKIIQIRDDILV